MAQVDLRVEGEVRLAWGACPPQHDVGCSLLWVEVGSIAGMDGWCYCACPSERAETWIAALGRMEVEWAVGPDGTW